jgi:chromosome partitioning protein
MFPSGLTLLDLRSEGVDAQLSMSHVAARAEVRGLLDELKLPPVGHRDEETPVERAVGAR